MSPRPRTAGFTLLEFGAVLLVLGFLAFSASLALGTLTRQRLETADKLQLRELGLALARYEHDTGHFPRAGWNDPLQRWHGGRTALGEPFDPAKSFFTDIGINPTLRHAKIDSRLFEHDFRRYAFPEPLGSGGWGYNPLLDGLASQDVTNRQTVVAFTSTAEPRGRALLETPFAHPPLDSVPTVHFRYSDQALVLWADGHISHESPSAMPPRNRYLGNNEKWRVGWFGPTNDNGYWNPRNTLTPGATTPTATSEPGL